MSDGCHRTTRELLLFRDRALPGRELEELAQHLPTCASCRGQLADAEAVGALVGETLELMGGPLSRGFADGVMKEIRARTEGAQERSGLEALVVSWRWLALGGLALAAAAATVLMPLLSASHAGRQDLEQAALQAENEAHIHSLTVNSPDTHSMILKTAEGHTVIWMISDSQFAGDSGSVVTP
jgi:hypothetical protein